MEFPPLIGQRASSVVKPADGPAARDLRRLDRGLGLVSPWAR